MSEIYELKRDESKCRNCGNCRVLPMAYYDGLAKHGYLLLSGTKLIDTQATVEYAVKNCHMDALTLERLYNDYGV